MAADSLTKALQGSQRRFHADRIANAY
jgi:hypothetical protein